MGFFRRLPLSLKVIGLAGLLLLLLSLALVLSHYFHFFTALGFSLLDDDSLANPLARSLGLLGGACTLPVAWYILRLGQKGEITHDTPQTGRVLLSVALLAAPPLVLLALDLFAPDPAAIAGITVWLTVLSAVLDIGWVVVFISRPMASADAASPPASGTSAASTSAVDNADATATPTTSGSGGEASVNSTTQSPTLFKSAWWSFDLGRYRPCDGTYCYFPYDSLPPIRALDGTLDWLGSLDPQTDREMEIHHNAPEARGKLAEIEAEAAKLGLTLPESFVRLMGSPELQDRILSCTACTFGLPKRILPCVGSEQGYIIRFLNDQQDMLIWYLFLTPGGEQRVIVTPYEFDEGEGDNPNDLPEDQRNAVIANTAVCAPSFEAFVYRWWLENTIWFKLNTSDGDAKLTDEERRYLAHYAPTPN